MNSALHSLIDQAEAGRALSRAEAEAFMEELLSGHVPTADIVRLLTALNHRAVEVQELAGFARVMRRHAARVFTEDESPGEENSSAFCSRHHTAGVETNR